MRNATLVFCLLLLGIAAFADEQKESTPTPSLRGITWQWMGLTDPLNRVQVRDPSRYTVAFAGNGAVMIRADCNRSTGTYAASEDGGISIQIGSMTKTMCPPESFSDLFAANLSKGSRYFFRDGHLFLDITDGGGTMEFLPYTALHYQCEDGTRLAVVFVKGEPPSAEIESDAGKRLLPLIPAASGAKYGSADTSFWTKDSGAVYQTAGKTVNCSLLPGV